VSRSRFPLLSDGERSALVSPAGNVEWLCLPRVDSPSVFGALLDRDAGTFRFGPEGVGVPADRRYLPGTLVLETTWMTSSGWVVVREALLLEAWPPDASRHSSEYRRAPGAHRAEHVLVRSATCVHGSVDLEMVCEPVLDYGSVRPGWTYAADGYGAVNATADDHPVSLALTSDMRIGFEFGRAVARTKLAAGKTAFVALTWRAADAPQVAGSPPCDGAAARDGLERTAAHWLDWLSRGSFPDHPWQVHLKRSALVLKGLIYEPTGAMVAAATTSLPETLGGARNWDYRYTWIRDATFALWGLYSLGLDAEAESFFAFVAEVTEATSGELQIMYGLRGEHELVEVELDHLSGYEDSRPVRIGNDAFDQSQHDVWGALLDSIYLHTRHHDALPPMIWSLVERQVEAAAARWRDPDHGIWEVRGAERHFTSSKLLCWVALERGARLARSRGADAQERRWRDIAAEIHADICAHGVRSDGAFTQHYDTSALDASLLLVPLLRFLPADDPRVRATVMAIKDELSHDGLVRRYRVEDTDDGLSGDEGAFVICSFWLVSALVEIGEVEQGRDLCARLLHDAGPLELYAEEIDPDSRRHLGNFPQAFSHLALINAVLHVIRAHAGPEDSASVR
jgi:GH15 family glucan-1,4-alpha-glucosidase